MAELLKKYNFAGDRLYFREKSHKYKTIVENVLPDILFEDDCRSIGGAWQMCITYIDNSIKEKIRSIVVKVFTGIDNIMLDFDTIWG